VAAIDSALDRALPADLQAERYVLGSILLDGGLYLQVAELLAPADFSLPKHRKIFERMAELHTAGSNIDRVTLTNSLMRAGELESVDGMSYIVSLDDGLPRIYNLDDYIKIVKDRSLLRNLAASAQVLLDRSLLGQEDPQQILAEAEEGLLKLSEQTARTNMFNPRRIIEEFDGGVNAFLDPANRIQGIGTGFRRFDEMTGGLHEGELIIIAARPSMGKTAVAMNIAQHVARNGKVVGVFSLEMSKESLLNRMVCAGARVDQSKFRAGFLSQDERRLLMVALNDLMKSPIYIDDTAGASLIDVHSKLRRLKAEAGALDLVIIDYLQLMSGRGRFENRNAEVSHLSRGLKLLSKELKVPMVVLSQLSRAPETRPGDGRPQLSDLRESGSIEQDADLVVFVYREEVYKPDREDLKGKAKLVIGKQRNGPIGDVNLTFLKHCTKFENPVEDLEE
jgi:replicative DNA helicase